MSSYKAIQEKGKSGSFIFGSDQADLRTSYQSNFLKANEEQERSKSAFNQRLPATPKDQSYVEMFGQPNGDSNQERLKMQVCFRYRKQDNSFIPKFKMLSSKERKYHELYGKMQKIVQEDNAPAQIAPKQSNKTHKKKQSDLRQQTPQKESEVIQAKERSQYNFHNSQVFNNSYSQQEEQESLLKIQEKQEKIQNKIQNKQKLKIIQEETLKVPTKKFFRGSQTSRNELISPQSD